MLPDSVSTTYIINQLWQFCEDAQWNNPFWFFCPQVLLSSPMGSWTARGQRAATKKMGPCALRAWMAASTVRMVLQRRGEIAFVCHPVCEAPGSWNICDSCNMASLLVSLSELISKDDAAASVDASCEDHETFSDVLPAASTAKTCCTLRALRLQCDCCCHFPKHSLYLFNHHHWVTWLQTVSIPLLSVSNFIEILFCIVSLCSDLTL